ncbi:MAG: hypothetical protein LUC97_08650 [Clostridiales bacterium]|nr:hypothetical protein [Clostridiales bacterium]
MVIIFSIAYLYVIAESIYLGIKEKNFFNISTVKADVNRMVRQYIKCICLVTLFDFSASIIAPSFFSNNIELLMILNMMLVLLSYNIKFFDKTLPLGCLLIAAAIVNLLKNGTDYNINWKIYPLVLFVLLLRPCAEKYNYQTILTSTAENGLIYRGCNNFINWRCL